MIYAKIDAPKKQALQAEMQATADAKWYRRLKIIDLSGQGLKVPDLAQLFDLAAGTIRRYIHAYNEAGLQGLRPGYGQGRLLAVGWSKAQWLDLLAQSPADLALLETGDQNWSQALLAQYLETYHQVRLTQATISKTLRRVGIRWRRAKRRVHSPDPLYVVKRQRIADLQQLALAGCLRYYKSGWFEVIVGKSLQENHDPKRFGFIAGHDEKPKRRLYETLSTQGPQMNQAITFLSDGGDTVRNLQYYMSPVAEHILDWFHITMKLTVMRNIAKGPPQHEELASVLGELERIKWFLWHGNAYQALEELRFLEMDLEIFEHEDEVTAKLYRHVQEFAIYIHNNRHYIPNYGDRYRYGEMISTAFAESTVNELISKRMVKKQQMRWTKEGAHLLLQTRVKTLDGDLRDKFVEWYPGMGTSATATQLPATARSSLSC